MQRKSAGAAALKKKADAYFSEPQNRPFSMQEACLALGIDYRTLCEWEAGANKKRAALARSVRSRVAAGWEKGEVSASLAALLFKTYGEGPAESRQTDSVEITVRVIGDDH